MSLMLKATALLLIGLGAAHLARRARASVRHGILLATFAAIAALPLAAAALPTLAVEVPIMHTDAGANALAKARALVSSGERETSPSTTGAPTVSGGPGFSLGFIRGITSGDDTQALMLSIWLTGMMLCLAWLAAATWRVQQLRRTALPARDLQRITTALESAGWSKGVDLLVHEQLPAPIACGIFRPAIVLPPDAQTWKDAALHRALVHELEHIKRRDWLTQLVARAVCAAYWFHPLVWMAQRRLCLYAEHACDDAVLARDDGATYADQLVALARRMAARPPLAALGMAQRSDLSARVSAVLDLSRPRGRAGTVRGAVIATVTATLLAALAPLTTRTAGAEQLTSQNGQRRERVSWRDRALLEAVESGDAGDVRELLDEGANANAAVDGDGSPLIVAAREGHFDLVRLLLDRGADPNLAVVGDGAPIIMAAREGHLRIVQLLLDRGADVDQIVPGDENALMQASGAGELEVVQLLVARGANVNARVQVNQRYEAVSYDDRGRRRVSGATAETWRTALSMAQRGGHRAVVEFLRSAGAVE